VNKYGKIEPQGLISYDEWAYAYVNKEKYFVSKKSEDSEIFFNSIKYDIFTLERILLNSVIVTENLKNELETKLYGVKFSLCENFK